MLKKSSLIKKLYKSGIYLMRLEYLNKKIINAYYEIKTDNNNLIKINVTI